MALFGWAVAAAFFAMILYALYQRRGVKVGLKIPFAAFFFEAGGHEDKSGKH